MGWIFPGYDAVDSNLPEKTGYVPNATLRC